MLFEWRGVSADGLQVSGQINAANRTVVTQQLHLQKITPLKICKRRQFFSQWLTQKIKPVGVIDFMAQLATLIKANVALDHALSLLATIHHKKPIALLINKIHQAILDGSSLHNALAQHPAYFNDIATGLVHAGEESGMLGAVLQQLVNYQRQNHQLKLKIKKALYYPGAVLCIALIITLGMLTFVVPQFQTIYASFGGQLPALTRYFIAAGSWLHQYGLALVLSGFLCAAIPAVMIRKNKTLQFYWQKMLLRIPFINIIIQAALLARWNQVNATMLHAGIPLIEALAISKQITANQVFRQAIDRVMVAVKSGSSFADALADEALFPKTLSALIAVGESTGNLVDIFNELAGIYQDTIHHLADNCSKLLEPVIMVILSIVIGGLIIAMYLPVFNIGKIM